MSNAVKEPPTPLPEQDDLAALARTVRKDTELWTRIVRALPMHELVPFSQLADAAGVTEEQARAHGAAITLKWKPANVVQWCARGLSWGGRVFDARHARLLGLSPWTIEKLALAGRTADLDALLAPTPQFAVRLRDGGRGAPALRWCDGRPLAAGAQGFYLACLTQPGVSDITLLLTPLLDDEALFELGRWLLSDPKQHKKARYALPPSTRLVRELASAHEHGQLPRRPWLYEGLTLVPAFRRWALRWWCEARGATRDELRFAFEHGAAKVALVVLEQWFPTREVIASEQVACEAWWARRVADVAELAMQGRRAIPMHAFRRFYLSNPFVTESLRGVVFDVEEHGLAWLDQGRLCSPAGPLEVDGHRAVYVAHPAVRPDPWPSEAEVGGPAPFAQRNRPCFALAQMPEPAALPEVPNSTWRARCAALGYVELGETGGGTVEAFRDTGKSVLRVHHRGYGRGGHGGAKPVLFERAKVEQPNPASESELVYDVRRLFGLDPMPPSACAPGLSRPRGPK